MAVATPASVAPVWPLDRLGRGLHDLRISVTDRCNFRCRYCMPREAFGARYRFLKRAQLLSFEEIERVAAIAAQLGVRKIRLTGGEPLLRRELEKLVARLAALPGIDDVALTTNASLLTRDKARTLAGAGLARINVSLDALDEATFRAMNDVDFDARRVLEGIDAAAAAGLAPIKINMVVQRGVNDRQIVPMAAHFRHSGHVVRYIEYMDVGTSNRWRLDQVLPAADVIDRLRRHWPLTALPANYPGEVANRWRFDDGGGEVGVIASVTRPFCGGCRRLRMSADGRLFTCLFAAEGRDLRALLRGGANDRQIRVYMTGQWQTRNDRYSELRGRGQPIQKPEMSYIGG